MEPLAQQYRSNEKKNSVFFLCPSLSLRKRISSNRNEIERKNRHLINTIFIISFEYMKNAPRHSMFNEIIVLCTHIFRRYNWVLENEMSEMQITSKRKGRQAFMVVPFVRFVFDAIQIRLGRFLSNRLWLSKNLDHISKSLTHILVFNFLFPVTHKQNILLIFAFFYFFSVFFFFSAICGLHHQHQVLYAYTLSTLIWLVALVLAFIFRFPISLQDFTLFPSLHMFSYFITQSFYIVCCYNLLCIRGLLYHARIPRTTPWIWWRSRRNWKRKRVCAWVEKVRSRRSFFSRHFRYDNLLSFRCDKLSDEKIM